MADKMCMVVSEGTFDKAYMPLIMGQTAAASGTEVHVFYTFFGTKLVTKKANPKLPGMMSLFTGMFRNRMKKVGIGNYMEFFKQTQDLGVSFYACTTTMGLMGVTEEDRSEVRGFTGRSQVLVRVLTDQSRAGEAAQMMTLAARLSGHSMLKAQG